jgi:hypothetical protein
MDEAADLLARTVQEATVQLGVEPMPGPESEDRYLRDGTLFAVAGPGRLEVRLPADIADAALRTPDTGPGSEGGGWVVFRPRSAEPHVGDRARAWFITAWRYASVQRG